PGPPPRPGGSPGRGRRRGGGGAPAGGGLGRGSDRGGGLVWPALPPRRLGPLRDLRPCRRRRVRDAVGLRAAPGPLCRGQPLRLDGSTALHLTGARRGGAPPEDGPLVNRNALAA